MTELRLKDSYRACRGSYICSSSRHRLHLWKHSARLQHRLCLHRRSLELQARLSKHDGATSEGAATTANSANSSNTVDEAPSRRLSPQPEVGAGLKAVWYGTEQFGKLLSLMRPPQYQQQQEGKSFAPSVRRMTREEILASIRADYDAQYFVSGVGDMAAYAPDCVFADPFVSFSGTQRFKQNVSNLGGLMSDIRLDIYDWSEGPASLDTRWRFSCILDLPWRPRLAAAGSTRHLMDLERGLVVRHEERWDVEPGKVLARLLRPAAKVPTNPWETFFLSASAGDTKGMWFVLSPWVLKVSAAAVAAQLAWGLLAPVVLGPGPGEAGQAGLLPLPVLVGCQVLAVGCVVTEVVKFAQGMQGGGTGTGGRF